MRRMDPRQGRNPLSRVPDFFTASSTTSARTVSIKPSLELEFHRSGLGLKSSGNNVELNLIVDSKRDVADLSSWFNELWNDQTITSDVRDKVLAELDRLHSDHAPEFIYYLTLFHLFRDYLDGDARPRRQPSARGAP